MSVLSNSIFNPRLWLTPNAFGMPGRVTFILGSFYIEVDDITHLSDKMHLTSKVFSYGKLIGVGIAEGSTFVTTRRKGATFEIETRINLVRELRRL